MADPATYTKGSWTDLLPAATKAKLENIENGIKANNDALVAETDAGRAITQAADAAAQRSTLGLGDSATLDVGTGAGDVAAGNAPAGAVTTHESTYAHANLPTANEKTRLGDIQAASGATTALKLANLTSPATPTQQGVALLGASGGATKLTKMPDGATAVWSNATWADVDGWVKINGGAAMSVSGGKLIFTHDGANQYASKTVAGAAWKKLVLKIRLASGIISAETIIINDKLYPFSSNGSDQVFVVDIGPSGNMQFYAGGYGSSNSYTLSVSWGWAGDYSYLTGSLSEEAARIANELGDSAGVGVAASGTITSNGTAPSDGDTVTIAGKVYTFKTALTPAEGEVLIVAGDATATMNNLSRAINKVGGTLGVDYQVAAAHPLVACTRPGGGLSDTITALSTGELGNSITLAKSAATLTLSGPTLTGGCSVGAAKIKTLNNAALGYVPAATPNKTATTSIGYFAVADCASGAQVTLPAGGRWAWEVTTYGATYNSVKSGTAAGGAAISGTASANLCMRYERVA